MLYHFIALGLDPSVISSGLSFISSGADVIGHGLTGMFDSEVAKTGFFFTLAAWLHSGRVKQEIKDNFTSLTTALNQLGSALRADLNKHSEILAEHSKILADIVPKVSNLENTKLSGRKQNTQGDVK